MMIFPSRTSQFDDFPASPQADYLLMAEKKGVQATKLSLFFLLEIWWSWSHGLLVYFFVVDY